MYKRQINDKILKWNEEKGVVDYKKPGGNTGYSPNLGKGLLGPNGMIYDSENNLLMVCQHGDRRIASLSNGNDQKSDFKTVVDNYDGIRLNSPNDLVMSKNGIIYFTDPPFAFFNLETSEFIDSKLKELVTTNTISKLKEESNKKIRRLSIAPLIAEAVKRIDNHSSVSSLFN